MSLRGSKVCSSGDYKSSVLRCPNLQSDRRRHHVHNHRASDKPEWVDTSSLDTLQEWKIHCFLSLIFLGGEGVDCSIVHFSEMQRIVNGCRNRGGTQSLHFILQTGHVRLYQHSAYQTGFVCHTRDWYVDSLKCRHKQQEQHLILFGFFFRRALLCGFSQKGSCCISKSALQLQTCCPFLFCFMLFPLFVKIRLGGDGGIWTPLINSF